jgi:hypothetical protein
MQTTKEPWNLVMKSFADKLEVLLNQECMEKPNGTPDYILAKYLIECLTAYNNAVIARDRHHFVKSKHVQST